MKIDYSEIEKVISGCLNKVEQFKSEHFYKIKANGLIIDGQQAILKFYNKRLHFLFSTPRVLNQDERHQLHAGKTPILLVSDDETIIIDFDSFSHISLSEFQNYDCTINRYRNSKFPSIQRKFHRLFIPTDHKLNMASFFDVTPLRVESTVFSNGIVLIELNGNSFHLFSYTSKDEKQNFLCIDSLQEINSENFLKCSETIQLAYAFISGHQPREQRYFFTSVDGLFEKLDGVSFDMPKRSLHSSYSPIPDTFHQLTFGIKHPRKLSKAIFDNLCKIIFINTSFRRTISLIVEGNTLSFELQATIYSVALEAITSILSEHYKTKLAPIKDKKIAKKIICDLSECISKYREQLDEFSFNSIIAKIGYLNTPTNKDKLLKPFDLLGINLPKKDKICIEKRNDILHGRMPLDSSKRVAAGFTLEQIVLSLHFCVNCLILKSVGYSGYMTYYPAINEINNNVKVSEYPIRVI